MDSLKAVRFLEKIRQKLLLEDPKKWTKNYIAEKYFNTTRQAFGQHLETGKKIDIEDFPVVRKLAKEAGLNDKQLNDLICEDADRIGKEKKGKGKK